MRVGSFPFRALGRARMAGETDGFVKIVADKKYDEILGVHIIGPRATELVAEAVLALRTRVHGRGADPHHPRAPDDVGGGGRGGARHARRGDSHLGDRCQGPEVRAQARHPSAGLRPASRLRSICHTSRDAPDGRVDRRRHDRPLDQEGRRRRSIATSRSSRSRPTRSTPRSRRPPPACLPRSRSRKARRSPSTASSRRSATAASRRRAPAAATPCTRRLPQAGAATPTAAAPAARRRAPATTRRRGRAPDRTISAGATRSRRRSSAASPGNTTSTSRRLHGTGIGGRVTKHDILGYLESRARARRRRAARPSARRARAGLSCQASASRSCRCR